MYAPLIHPACINGIAFYYGPNILIYKMMLNKLLIL